MNSSLGFVLHCTCPDLHFFETRLSYFELTKLFLDKSLEGKTPQQMRAGFKPFRLTAHLRKSIPSERLPITAGRIHVIRKVDPQGTMTMFNESWSVHKKWMGEYVWATIDTAQQQIDFWHRPDSESDWIHIQTRAFHLKEPVQKLLPEFYRNRARCREQLPG